MHPKMCGTRSSAPPDPKANIVSSQNGYLKSSATDFLCPFGGMWVQPNSWCDFTKNFAPAMHNVAYFSSSQACVANGCNAIIIDVKTAFLHVDLDEEVYMRPYRQHRGQQ